MTRNSGRCHGTLPAASSGQGPGSTTARVIATVVPSRAGLAARPSPSQPEPPARPGSEATAEIVVSQNVLPPFCGHPDRIFYETTIFKAASDPGRAGGSGCDGSRREARAVSAGALDADWPGLPVSVAADPGLGSRYSGRFGPRLAYRHDWRGGHGGPYGDSWSDSRRAEPLLLARTVSQARVSSLSEASRLPLWLCGIMPACHSITTCGAPGRAGAASAT